jgi:hypothetical protein
LKEIDAAGKDAGRFSATMELMEEIGRGSQGVVYRAHQKTSFVFDFFLFFPGEGGMEKFSERMVAIRA